MIESDVERLARIESQLKYLTDALELEQETRKALSKELTIATKKLNNAESWGRGMLWTLIALGGIASQINTFIAWIKKF
jgi:hypothetical protein